MADERLLRQMGDRIAHRRRELGLTQEELAERMNVSVQMISNLENGKKGARPENIVKLCAELSVSADYILRGRRAEGELSDMARRLENLPEEKIDILRSIIDSWV